MQLEETAIPAVKIVTPKKHGDARGFFREVYSRSAWEKAGLAFTFVQDNHSYSAVPGTLRGLHSQTPPFAQDKLVRVARASAAELFRAAEARRGRKRAGTSDAKSKSQSSLFKSLRRHFGRPIAARTGPGLPGLIGRPYSSRSIGDGNSSTSNTVARFERSTRRWNALDAAYIE